MAKEKKDKLIKKFTPERMKEIVLDLSRISNDSNYMAEKLGEDIFPKFLSTVGGERNEARKDFDEKALELTHALSLDTHFALMDSLNKKYQAFARDFSSQLVNEYKCTTVLEKSLAEIITSSFIRVIDNSRRLNDLLNCTDIGINRNIYIANLSKQVDRAHRQYLSSLMTLRQIKAPSIEMNIRAHTAFVSQNQQINVDKKTNEA